MSGSPLRVRFAPGTKHRMRNTTPFGPGEIVWTVQFCGNGYIILLSDSGRAELYVSYHWARKNLRAVPKGKKP